MQRIFKAALARDGTPRARRYFGFCTSQLISGTPVTALAVEMLAPFISHSR